MFMPRNVPRTPAFAESISRGSRNPEEQRNNHAPSNTVEAQQRVSAHGMANGHYTLSTHTWLEDSHAFGPVVCQCLTIHLHTKGSRSGKSEVSNAVLYS